VLRLWLRGEGYRGIDRLSGVDRKTVRRYFVAPRLKQSLEQASRDAERRHLAAIDPAALLLGRIEVEDALSNRLLRDLRVDPDQLRKALRALTGVRPR